MDGSLNIEYHVRRLIVIAIAKYKTTKEQSEALGISINTFKAYRKKYGI